MLKKEVMNGKLMIGESAGAIICSSTITYIEQMDKKPEDYSQEDDKALILLIFMSSHIILLHHLRKLLKRY